MRTTARRAPAFAATLAAMTAIGAARADDDPLAAARVALEEQRYDDARALVRADLASGVSRRRMAALEVTATALLLDGQPAEAATPLRDLFTLAPAFVLRDPSLPPRVTAPFAAEAARPHERAVAISAVAATDGSARFSLRLSKPAARVELACRPEAGGLFVPVALAAETPTRLAFRLPTAAPHRCFGVASDADDAPLGRLGLPDAPVTLRPEAPPAGLLGRWWFWTAAGAVVVAGVAVAYVETRPRHVAAPPADIGVVARAFSLP